MVLQELKDILRGKGSQSVPDDVNCLFLNVENLRGLQFRYNSGKYVVLDEVDRSFLCFTGNIGKDPQNVNCEFLVGAGALKSQIELV